MIAAGSMDGGVVVISEVDKNINGKIEFNSIVHSKYVVRVKWGDDFLVSASYDKSLCLFSFFFFLNIYFYLHFFVYIFLFTFFFLINLCLIYLFFIIINVLSVNPF